VKFADVFLPVFVGLSNRRLTKDVAALSAAEVVCVPLSTTIDETLLDQNTRNDQRREENACDDNRGRLDSAMTFAIHLV